MTTEKISRYHWLLEQLNDPVEKERLTEELTHFLAGTDSIDDAHIYKFCVESMKAESLAYRNVHDELGRAFVWAASKYGAEYWEATQQKYFDLRQTEVRANLKKLYDDSQATALGAANNLKTHEAEIAAANARIEAAVIDLTVAEAEAEAEE